MEGHGYVGKAFFSSNCAEIRKQTRMRKLNLCNDSGTIAGSGKKIQIWNTFLNKTIKQNCKHGEVTRPGRLNKSFHTFFITYIFQKQEKT